MTFAKARRTTPGRRPLSRLPELLLAFAMSVFGPATSAFAADQVVHAKTAPDTT